MSDHLFFVILLCILMFLVGHKLEILDARISAIEQRCPIMEVQK